VVTRQCLNKMRPNKPLSQQHKPHSQLRRLPQPRRELETVIEGVIYDGSTEPGKPIVGASISYDVYSYFSGLQEGKPNKTRTDQLGKFVLPVTVHDTDSIRILIEAQGYISCEEKLVGVDLLGGRVFEIGLTPD
jgi:hypothetical protein